MAVLELFQPEIPEGWLTDRRALAVFPSLGAGERFRIKWNKAGVWCRL